VGVTIEEKLAEIENIRPYAHAVALIRTLRLAIQQRDELAWDLCASREQHDLTIIVCNQALLEALEGKS